MSNVKVRFAPSPTGMIHIGNVRTALFNWLFCKKVGGEFVLRIEDTDSTRNSSENVDLILEAMNWLGLDYSGVPVFQSARKAEHKKAAYQLLEKGSAYWCDCSREDIKERTGKDTGYDSFCKNRGLVRSDSTALRFRVESETISFEDLVKGSKSFPGASFPDFVILRSNGDPVYLLANCIDDHIDAITHVIRGEDHLSNTPKQILLLEALGYDIPVYGHLPLIVNSSGKKVSKRKDKVDVNSYREEGFLAETMVNYLALLGWSPADGQELLTKEELVRKFDISRVQVNPAQFDEKKLLAFNGDKLRQIPINEFQALSLNQVEKHLSRSLTAVEVSRLSELTKALQTRVSLTSEIGPMLDFVLSRPAVVSGDKELADKIILDVLRQYAWINWTGPEIHRATVEVALKAGVKISKAQAPIRLAITGSKVGLPLFESMAVLGRSECVDRLTDWYNAL